MTSRIAANRLPAAGQAGSRPTGASPDNTTRRGSGGALKQRDIIRGMSPAKKLALAEQMWHEARRLKEASVRTLHPDWPESKVLQAVREAFLRAQT